MTKTIINDVCINNTKIALVRPLEIEIEECYDGTIYDYIAIYDDGECLFEFGTGDTKEVAIKDLKNQFDFLYKLYCCTYTGNKLDIKKRVLQLIGADEGSIWIVPLREMSYRDAKREIIEYRKSYNYNADVTDLIGALWIDIELVMRVVGELDKEHQFRWI